MDAPSPRVAFVTPWYGPDISGGMEHATYQLVTNLNAAGVPVEVLTTTIRDFRSDWGKNSHKPGSTLVEGVPVHRFPVEERDREAFDAVNWKLIHDQPVTPAEELLFMREQFRAPQLYDHIARHRDSTIFFFTPYLFATTYFGAQIAPERSAIIPCLHDESYAHMALMQEVMPRVRALVMFAEAESRLATRLYGSSPDQLRSVAGLGVQPLQGADGNRFRQKYALDGPFLLYAGRKDPGKNVPMLLDYWRRYAAHADRAKLVLIGPGETPIHAGNSDPILDLGFVREQDKADAYAAATVLCQPSKNESFSFVIMESWLAETPVLVHGDCAVTLEHVQQGNGGLYFRSYPEFAATVDYLFGHPQIAHRLACQGKHYVEQNFTWELVVTRYKQLIAQMAQAAI